MYLTLPPLFSGYSDDLPKRFYQKQEISMHGPIWASVSHLPICKLELLYCMAATMGHTF